MVHWQKTSQCPIKMTWVKTIILFDIGWLSFLLNFLINNPIKWITTISWAYTVFLCIALFFYPNGSLIFLLSWIFLRDLFEMIHAAIIRRTNITFPPIAKPITISKIISKVCIYVNVIDITTSDDYFNRRHNLNFF